MGPFVPTAVRECGCGREAKFLGGSNAEGIDDYPAGRHGRGTHWPAERLLLRLWLWRRRLWVQHDGWLRLLLPARLPRWVLQPVLRSVLQLHRRERWLVPARSSPETSKRDTGGLPCVSSFLDLPAGGVDPR